MTVENLRQFVRRHSIVYMALNGCLQRFDELANEFVRVVQSESTQSERLAKLLRDAENELYKLEDEKVRPISSTYDRKEFSRLNIFFLL